MEGNCFEVLLAQDMKASDNYTINELSIPSKCLMERAALGVAKCIAEKINSQSKVLFLCGFGNNGGDGFACARILKDEFNITSFICYVGKIDEDSNIDESKMSIECKRQYNLAINSKLPVFYPSDLKKYINKFDLVVDAVFGIGLSRDVVGEIAETFKIVINSKIQVLAIDVPSGLDTNKATALGQILPADYTIAIQNLKPCHVLYPGADFCGKIRVIDIGVKIPKGIKPYAIVPNDTILCKIPAKRERHTNKGSFGKLCLVCGSKGMCGAAYMSCKAALRSGIGLAYIITDEENREVLQSLVPEAIVVSYSSENDFENLTSTINSADGFVIGCGLGKSNLSVKLLKYILRNVPSNKKRPIVIDADGLNIISENTDIWKYDIFKTNDVVITPHPFEMSRISGEKPNEILRSMIDNAVNFAIDKNVTVVLKDAHTVVASKNGIPYINVKGNSGMAKGGSGDVLAGIMGSILTQHIKQVNSNEENNFDIAKLCAYCVYLHGKVGDIVSEQMGEIGMLPTDIIEKIPYVLKNIADTKTYLEG